MYDSNSIIDFDALTCRNLFPLSGRLRCGCGDRASVVINGRLLCGDCFLETTNPAPIPEEKQE